jgi:hypothetical protein
VTCFLALFALFLAVPRVYTPTTPAQEYEKVPAPSIQMRISEASATTVPWIDSNAWRFVRGLKKALYEKLPERTAPLAAAEAHAWGADALLEPAPGDADKLKAMLAFIEGIDAPRLPQVANIGLIDDGSEEMAEVMNLLSRRNLLYRVVTAPDPRLDINVRLGSEQYPRSAVENPNDFAARVREKLSDEKRLLRLFGTYTVLANLTSNSSRARLYLVNYAPRPARHVRVRVLGTYQKARLREAADAKQEVVDYAVAEGATEFTIPQIAIYAVVDLEK